MPSAWITHVKSVYAAGKKKNASYKYGQAMKDAKSTYKRAGKAASNAVEEKAAPKKRRRKKKKPDEESGRKRVKQQHTKGLGNVEEGRLAEAAAPKKKRQRKRPTLGSQYKTMN